MKIHCNRWVCVYLDDTPQHHVAVIEDDVWASEAGLPPQVIEFMRMLKCDTGEVMIVDKVYKIYNISQFARKTRKLEHSIPKSLYNNVGVLEELFRRYYNEGLVLL